VSDPYPLAHKAGIGATFSPKQRLVAAGTAAVLTVYAVGYVRTAPAAHRAEIVAAIAKSPPKSATGYKDGTYLGRGRCRHGVLEASVVIKDGRIVDASISQCFTRYSKNVIAILPGQVVVRQSADVDRVTRATESSDAFYEAVLRALALAK
jgi:uncharacterized protein with FMN-binding domain